MKNVIRVSAVVLMDAGRRILHVRKRGTSVFMLPGGKAEPGESDAEAAVREIAEEVGVTLNPDGLASWGEVVAPAANETGSTLVAAVFASPRPVAGARPAAEIEELLWAHPGVDPGVPLAPLTLALLPRLREFVASAPTQAVADSPGSSMKSPPDSWSAPRP